MSAQSKKRVYDTRVEELTGLLANIIQRFLLGNGFTIGSVRTHSVPHINDRKNARPVWDIFLC
jgi:hypothetical protein